MDSSPLRNRFDIGVGLTLIGTALALALPAAQAISGHYDSKRTERQAMVKIAVDILSQKPPAGEDGKPAEFPLDQQAMRLWAARVINGNHDQKLSESPSSALITGKAWFDSGYGYDDYTWEKTGEDPTASQPKEGE